ncbi:MAG: glutaredoxin domain-containing protein [Candidatus Bathyarchaeota archaeon]
MNTKTSLAAGVKRGSDELCDLPRGKGFLKGIREFCILSCPDKAKKTIGPKQSVAAAIGGLGLLLYAFTWPLNIYTAHFEWVAVFLIFVGLSHFLPFRITARFWVVVALAGIFGDWLLLGRFSLMDWVWINAPVVLFVVIGTLLGSLSRIPRVCWDAITKKKIAMSTEKIKFTKVSGENTKHNVLLYTLTTCAWCKRLKKLLTDNNITYEYVDVDLYRQEDREQVRQDILNRGGELNYPAIIIDNKILINGFQKNKIQDALDI